MPCVTGWLAGRARSHPPHHRLGDSVIPWAPTWTSARHSPHLPPMAPLARAVLRGKLLEPVATIGSWPSPWAPSTAKLTLRAWEKSFKDHVMPPLKSMAQQLL